MTARILVLAALVAATAATLRAAVVTTRVVPARPLSELPYVLGDWHGEQLPDFDRGTLDVLAADQYLTRVYRSRGDAADLYVGFYESQRRGDTMHSPMNCLPAAGWQPVESRRISIDAGRSSPIDTNRFVVQKGLDKRLVLYWYQSHGRTISSEYASKVYLVWDALRIHRTDSAIVRVITPIRTGEAAAEESALRFIRALAPALDQNLPG